MPAPHHSIFTGWMLFLVLNQQHQSTEHTWYTPELKSQLRHRSRPYKKLTAVAKWMNNRTNCLLHPPMINSGDSTFETNGMFVTHHHFHHPQQHDMVNFSQSFHLILYHLPSLQLMQHNHQQVVKVIWHKATSPPNMDGSVVFTRWRQCAPRI